MATPAKSTFMHSGSDEYDRFMGRFSKELAPRFLDSAGIEAPMTALDVGCGPGALTSALVQRLGPKSVAACDSSPVFAADCAERNPGVIVKPALMESLPFDDDLFDATLTQLVLHFVSDPPKGVSEMMRVTRSGGIVAGSVWAVPDGMEMLMLLMRSIGSLGANITPPERDVKFGAPGELTELFESAGLKNVREEEITVSASYADFDDYWRAMQHAPGPAGAAMAVLSEEEIDRLRTVLFENLGRPAGQFSLSGTAHAAYGSVP